VLFISLRSNPSNLASLLVFVVVLYRLQPRIKDLDDARVQLLSFAGGVGEVIGLLATTRAERVVDGDRPADGLEPGFRLEHVSMRYGPDLPLALDDVTLEIPAGRTTALVGPSGAGKSTVIDLLLRFTAPESGRVTFGGVEVQDLRVASLRARTAMVSQEVYLFNDSVRANIAYGHEGATDADIERAARLAHAHDFIMGLPRGYDTIVGEDGVRLSGGQRQRITLARAIVRDPDVLILDEATNALDSISEHMVQEAIDLLSGDRTIVVIAHRLSTIRRADHVVVLDQGRVAVHGTPAELLAADGMFARLCSLQHITATEPAS
jgi:subfamily B ATP-binding cassette protein MsbA